MCDAATSYCTLGDVTDTNVETLPENTPPNTRFRYIDLSAVEAGAINWSAVTETTFGAAPSRARRVLKSLDVLFGTVRPNRKSHGFIGPDNPGPFIASTGFSVVCGRDGVSHPGYLFHSLMSDHVTAQAVRDAIGSSYPALNDSDVRRLQIFLPKYEEQQRISQVLDTLDTAIHETEAIIVKLKAVKQGLLHDLLTRGIDANGELRLPQTEAPHLYKMSPLGWIPDEWNILNLGYCAEISSGVTLGRMLTGHGLVQLPYLRVANVQDGYVDLSDVKTVQVLRNEVERFALADGDVLMNEGGDYDKLGRGTVWRAQIQPCLHQNHVFRVRCNQDVLVPDYLAAFSASRRGKAFFIFSSKQSTNLASINSTQLRSFPILCPHLPEQRQIIERLASADGCVSVEEIELQKLRELKSALMDDLLTGRVRVTPLLPAENTPKSA